MFGFLLGPSSQNSNVNNHDSSSSEQQQPLVEKVESRLNLSRASVFLGELRDGLTMINMQSAFLIVSKGYTEKQAGVLFFVFGLAQFAFQGPAGYLYDYTDQKVLWLSTAAIITTICTIGTALFAAPGGNNFLFMILIKAIQGAVTSFIPPGLNSITQGIVGSAGMTSQVSLNEMANQYVTTVLLSLFVISFLYSAF
jgi:hypothetical protein